MSELKPSKRSQLDYYFMVDTERLIIIVALLCLLIGGTWFGVTIYRNSAIPHPTVATAPQVAPPAPQAKHWAPSYLELQPGDTGVLDTGNGMTDVAATPTALIGMARAASKDDTVTYHAFFKRNAAYQVADGTKATLLVGGAQINEVRVIDGPYAGHTGWIAMEWIRRPDEMPRKDRQ